MQTCQCLHEPSVGFAGSANLLMIVIFLPLISLMGIVLNFFNIIVFAEQKSTSSKYLTALSCSDVGVCMAGILVIWSDSMRAHSHLIDQIFVFLLPNIIPLGLFFQMLSVYITVLAAFDCFFSVYSGVKAGASRSTWAPRVLCLVVISVAAYNIIQFADLQAVECLHPDNFTLFELCPTELRISDSYVTIYKGYMYALSMAIVPFILLTLLTIAILSLLRRKESSKMDDRTENAGSPTVLLLVIVLFLLCNLTSLLVNIFEMMKIHLHNSAEAVLIDVGNFLVVVNATANFFVYFFSSDEYRISVRRKFSHILSFRFGKSRIDHRPKIEFV